jgi:hypothetical protein
VAADGQSPQPWSYDALGTLTRVGFERFDTSLACDPIAHSDPYHQRVSPREFRDHWADTEPDWSHGGTWLTSFVLPGRGSSTRCPGISEVPWTAHHSAETLQKPKRSSPELNEQDLCDRATTADVIISSFQPCYGARHHLARAGGRHSSTVSSEGWPALLHPEESAATAEWTEPAWVADKAGPPARWPGPETWDYQGDHCGSRRVLTISLQIMINLRFSL